MNLEHRIYVQGLDPAEQDALDVLVAQWRAKRRRNNLRAAFYDLKNSARSLMGQNVPNEIRKQSFVLGWSAIAVDKLNRRCNIDGFYDVNGYDLDSLGLAEFAKANRLASEISQAGVSSLIHGPAFLVTTLGDTESGEPPVLMHGRDAGTSTGIWDVRRRAITSFLSITELDDDGEPTAMTMYLPNVNLILTRVGGEWTVDRREHSYGVPVDMPRYKPRLGRPFGSSRITRAVMSMHMQALGAMIRADVNGRAYSLSRYVLLGATEQAFQNADGSPKAAWQAAWDAVWAIGDDVESEAAKEEPSLARADVKQFTGQSPEPQNAHLRMLAQMFSGETGIPIGELGIIGDANPTSAEALETSRDDLIAEAGQTTEGWSPDVESAITRALTMLNDGKLPPNLDIRASWRKPIYVSAAQAADGGSKIIGTLPWLADTSVGLELLGLSPDQARRALAERQKANGLSILDRLAGRSGGNGNT